MTARHWVALLVTIVIAACGGPPRTVPGGDTKSLDRLYTELADPLPAFDPALLSGFRVVIDPGHGGSFRGTVGQDSLEESDVNLGVSLHLWGLLREAGADAHMTRTADRDFLTAVDSTLASDLQKRVDQVDSLAPDVFISIHHNAQPQRDPSYNRVETYYKAGDPASLDLAFAIHRHLMRNLGIEVGEVRQGNYYVLRNVDVAAVLGESSYLTHPPVEDKLRLSRTQKLEAEAYFLGIVDYCRRGIPRVAAIEPTDSIQTTVPTVTCSFVDRGGLGIDPDGVHLSINGTRVEAVVASNGRRASYPLPWDSPNGDYDVAVTARNLGGNTSPVSTTYFRIEHPPALAAIDVVPPRVSRAGAGVRVRARILDRRGLPVADGTAVEMTTSLQKEPVKSDVRAGAVEFALDVPAGATKAVRVNLAVGDKRFGADIPVDASRTSTAAWRTLSVRDGTTSAPIVDVVVTVGDSVLSNASPTGAYGFATESDEVRVAAPGYRPVEVAKGDSPDVAMTPWFAGALMGKRFVLDPQGGPPLAVGVGPLGLSAAHVNLRVANYLEGFLRAAGAEVRLTRTDEEVRLPEDVARLTNRFRADRYIEIRHPSAAVDSPRVLRAYFFPGSANGEALARTVGETAASRLGVPFRGPVETVTYALQQTACPAIVVAAPPISDAGEEKRLDRAAYQREQAYAIFLGILRHYGVTEAGALEVEVAGGAPAGWIVTLDGTWTLVTDEDGRVSFECVPPGSHDVVLRRANDVLSRHVVTADLPARLQVQTTR
jgi:N-acetylmuramoyl-L-alanine amidase